MLLVLTEWLRLVRVPLLTAGAVRRRPAATTIAGRMAWRRVADTTSSSCLNHRPESTETLSHEGSSECQLFRRAHRNVMPKISVFTALTSLRSSNFWEWDQRRPAAAAAL